MENVTMKSLKTSASRSSATLLAAMLCACSGNDNADKSQVVARVNDAEITVSQLRTALLAKNAAQPTPQATQQALDGLVNEQLLVDAALANKLDRDPTVVQAVEAAKRQLLARAYLERTVFPKQEIPAVEQAAYYKSNPALFAERRVYQVAVFTAATDALPAEIVEELGAATTSDGVATVLAARDIAFEVQNMTRTAEQLPLDQLPRFAAASVGDIVIQPPRAGQTTVMFITGTQDAPLAFESAQPIIQQYLANVRNAEALDSHLKLARAAANISQPESTPLGATATATTAAGVEREPQQSRAQQSGAAILN
jgi:EpsD family peptidyl-prolyl cis-trans isomerase